MIIKIKRERGFGLHRKYPACDNAKLVISLWNGKVFSEKQIETLTTMGIKVKEVK
ncbi:hypothetical protein KAT92_05260 [Candidatus Babeliales bacterium]|nr:hypothetical protein [Candidatus Babeliales bacterium]